MAFSNLWHGRTGRLPYLVVLVISSAAIAVLPFIAGKIITAVVAGGPDPALAILRTLLRPLLLGVGLLIAGGPLVIFTRRRMRELGFSGVWLLLFPLGPLWMLLSFGIADGALMVWPLPAATSPVMTTPFWIEFAFGALLAVLPSGDYLEHSANPILRFAHFATSCEGRLSRRTFALHLAIALGSTIVVGVFSPVSVSKLARPGEHSVPVLVSVMMSATALASVFVNMFLTASTIRRLHDLDQKAWWIVLFPFGLVSLMSAFVLVPLIANPQLIAVMLVNPFVMFSAVQGVGCLILLVRLLLKRGSDLGNSYGPPVIPPDPSLLPA